MISIIFNIGLLLFIVIFSTLAWHSIVKRSRKELPRIILYLNFIIGCFLFLLTDIEPSRIWLSIFVIGSLAMLIFALFWERKDSRYKTDG